MELGSVREGDIVEISKRGRRFYAVVREKESSRLKVRPITSGITYFDASAREVIEHWKRRKR